MGEKKKIQKIQKFIKASNKKCRNVCRKTRNSENPDTDSKIHQKYLYWFFGQNMEFWHSVLPSQRFSSSPNLKRIASYVIYRDLSSSLAAGDLPKKKVIKNGDSNIIFDILIFKR